MRAYLAYFPYSKLLRAAFIPILMFTLIAGAVGAFSTVEYEGETHKFERYEHKMATPVRAHSTPIKFVPAVRLPHHGITPVVLPEPHVPVLVVSLSPIIYITLKRLLLQPLRYTSNLVHRSI
jgi:hypothetical protein